MCGLLVDAGCVVQQEAEQLPRHPESDQAARRLSSFDDSSASFTNQRQILLLSGPAEQQQRHALSGQSEAQSQFAASELLHARFVQRRELAGGAQRVLRRLVHRGGRTQALPRRKRIAVGRVDTIVRDA